MLDETERLANDERLLALLEWYLRGNDGNRERWQDRVMQWEGASASDLTRWHGELVAFAWIEQNLATSAKLQSGGVLQAYRATNTGRNAAGQARSQIGERLARKSA